MAKSSSPPPDRQGRLQVAVFSAVIGSFLASTMLIEWTSGELDANAEQIVSNAMPSIELLASIRGSTHEVELLVSRRLHGEPWPSAVDTSFDRLKDEVVGYLRLPSFPREAQYYDELENAWALFSDAFTETRELSGAGNEREARETFAQKLVPAAARLNDAAITAIDFNAQNARSLASQIRQIRQRTVWLGRSLTAFCVALGAAGGVLLYLQGRNRRAVLRANSELAEARAAELEQFAGRVAHDLRNPLSSARMACAVIMQDNKDESLGGLVDRIIRSISRADAIITDLLNFARAGGNADPGARTDVREVMNDLVTPMTQQAEQARIEMHLDPIPPVLVACAPGVYLSLASNLVRNAMKYMGNRDTRQITVRVIDQGSMVRTEVIDTGAGVSVESLPQLFEPYFRAQGGRDGLGLGLATVKKLAEGHHGRVGVSSTVGVGSTFWFELPRAGTAFEWTKDEQSRGAPVLH
jgi:signal transduction histidine kinase